MADLVDDLPVDSCGHATCDRSPGQFWCERCSRNLEALSCALAAEGIELSPVASDAGLE
jgi:hypothetical protein